jgi:uncharacterized membrane protein YkvA (DUF1232 family)
MNVAHVSKYVRSRSVARWKKMLGVFSVVYTILPVDFIPDVLPMVGWLDDIGFLAVAFAFIARDMAKNAKLDAEDAQKQNVVPPGEQVIDVSAQPR